MKTVRKLWRYEKMANSKNSSTMAVPEAKAAMDRFKTEVASEMGLNFS